MRRLEFVTPDAGALAAAAANAAQGELRAEIAITNDLARQVAARLRGIAPQLLLVAEPAKVAVVCETDGDKLATALMAYAERPDVTVIAPITDRFWNQRSLFLISIPKSGTHLLTELARAFGYASGEECPPNPKPAH